MPFKNPQNSITVPTGAGPAQSRIVIGSDIPAALQTAFSTSFTISAAVLYYYSNGDYYFDAIGIDGGGNPTLIRGAYIVATSTLIRYETYRGGSLADGAIVFYGSEGNPSRTTQVYRKSEINLDYNGVTGQESFMTIDVPGLGALHVRPTQPIYTAIGNGNLNVAAAPELGYPLANWVQYPSADFKDGHVFKVTLDCMIFTSAAAVGKAANIRLRQGTAPSIAGNLLAEWVTDPVNSFITSKHYESFFYNNTGTNLSLVDLELGFLWGAGAGTHTLAGDATRPIILNVFDWGLITTAGVPTSSMRAMV